MAITTTPLEISSAIRRTLLCACLVSLVSPALIGAEAEPVRLKGMLQEIVVKKAAELGVTAPAGEYVAVLDQAAPRTNPKASQMQDHHNGWLQLSPDTVEGGSITVMCKYYIPSSSENKPDSIRMTVRKRTKDSLVIYADKSFKVSSSDTDKWLDLELLLPLKEVEGDDPGAFILMISAVPLAGPVYLDSVGVFDGKGQRLWVSPSFE